LFMDEERASTTPFLFFTDFHGELAAAVRDGRRREFKAFSAFASPEAQAHIPDPNAEETFLRSASFRPDESEEQQDSCRYYRALLAIRKRIIAPALENARSRGATVLGDKCVLARWHLPGQAVLAIYVNLSAEERSISAARGELLFESSSACGAEASQGRLAAFCTVAFLESEDGEEAKG